MMTNNTNRPDGTPTTDPARSGARTGALGSFANDPASAFAESGPMSALLAQNWWAVAIRGVCGIIFGIVALLMPGVTIGALVLLFAAYMLVDGVFAIIAGVRAATHHQRWGALILEGIVDLAAGVIAIVMPIASILAFVWLSAAWAIVSGVLLLAAVFRLHRAHGKWLMALGGIVSVIWGVLLFIAPIAGAVVMTIWLGAYALVFGVVLLVLAFRLRQHRNEPAGAHAARA
jgi:uncharacterized membrane protein HdeD (DUF308 family)